MVALCAMTAYAVLADEQASPGAAAPIRIS